MRKHISYSELKTWDECAYKHKLVYIDKVKNFQGNEYTAFGTAVHEVCEKSVLKEIKIDKASLMDCFNKKFLQEIQELITKKERPDQGHASPSIRFSRIYNSRIKQNV